MPWATGILKISTNLKVLLLLWQYKRLDAQSILLWQYNYGINYYYYYYLIIFILPHYNNIYKFKKNKGNNGKEA